MRQASPALRRLSVLTEKKASFPGLVGLWLQGLMRDEVISGGPPQLSVPQEPGWAVREKEAMQA